MTTETHPVRIIQTPEGPPADVPRPEDNGGLPREADRRSPKPERTTTA
jgi:hypothetical protein